MNKKILTSLVVSGTLIAFASCYKNDRKDPTYTSISDAFASFAPNSKTVDMDAATGGSFRGNSGSRYEFPANAFVTRSGATVAGTIKIEVREYLTKSDMFFSDLLPVTDSESLISAGEVYVHATQNGQELFLQHGVAYAVNLPQKGTVIPGMSVFHVSGDSIRTINTVATTELNAKVKWRPVYPVTPLTSIIYNGDTVKMFNDSLEYGNADKFMSNPNYQTFQLSLTTSDGSTLPDWNNVDNVVEARCLYDGLNGIWRMKWSSDGIIYEHHVPDIPVHFVVTSIVGGRFYGGILAAIPATGSTYNVVLQPTTPSAFKTLIDAL